MHRRLLLSLLPLLVLAGLWPGAAAAGVVVLGDGRALRHVGEPRVSGPLTFVQLASGVFLAVRTREIDWEATARAAAMVPEAPGVRPGAGPVVPIEEAPEAELIAALVHTASRRWVGPREELGPTGGRDEGTMSTAPGAWPPVGPPRPAYVPEPPPLARLAVDADGPRSWRRGFIGPPPLAAARAEEPGPRPRFTTPRPGEVVAGLTELSALPARDGAAVVGVEFAVDGSPVGRRERPPWTTSFRFPPERRRHRLEARFLRADGSRERAAAEVEAVAPSVALEVELVPLTVTVSNRDWFFVRNLQASDFTLYEDGVRQEVAHFSRNRVPLSLAVLVDTSWSMHGRRLEMARAGLARLAETLSPGDRVAVGGFDERLTWLVPFASAVDGVGPALAGALDRVEADGTTAMFDAVLEALGPLGEEDGRRVLVILGDGEDYASRARLEKVVAEVQRHDVTVYAVGLVAFRLKDGLPDHWSDVLEGKGRPRHWADRMRQRGLDYLRRQAEATGGVLYLPRWEGELPYVFEHLMAELRSAYALGYYPSNTRRDGGFRTIRVAVGGIGLEARTRRGYYAPGDAPVADAVPGMVSRGGERR